MGQREIILHTLMKQQHEISMQILKALPPQDTQDFEGAESMENSTTADVPNEARTTRTTASRMSEPLRSEKPLQNTEKMQTPRVSYREAEKTARYLYDLRKSYILLAQNRFSIQQQYGKDLENIPQLDARANTMENKIEKLDVMRGYVAELKIERRNLPFWKRKRKREIDEEIERTETDIRIAENYFNSTYHIPLYEAPYEINRIRNEARFKERELERKNVKIAEIAKELEAIDTEYRAQWQLAEQHADICLIEKFVSQMREPYISARDNLRQVQVLRTFDTAKNKKKNKNG